MGRLWKLHDRWVQLAFARPGRAAALLGIFLAPALLLTIQLFGNIHAGLEDLLPPETTVVQSLRKIHAVMSGKSSVIVIASSPDADTNRKFISELGHRLEEHPLQGVRFLRYDVNEERSWGYERAPLLMSQEEFEDFMKQADQAASEARARANPLLIRFDDAPAASPDWSRIRDTLHAKMAAYDRFPRGYLETPDGKTVVAMLWLKGSETDFQVAENLMHDLEREVSFVKKGYPDSLHVAYNGEVVNMIEEHHAILSDLSLSSIVVLLLVGGAIALYFRSWRALATSILSIVPGLLVTFALGRLTVGGLNSNTAFLGSIIAGNGINYPLVLLAYYRRQPGGMADAEAVRIASRQGFAGTLGAAVTSSAAYGALALSDFRGFSQFGWVGAMGMVTVWLFTMITLPLLVRWLRPARAADGTVMQRLLQRFFGNPRLAFGVTAAVIALGTIGVAIGVHAGREGGLYEMNLKALRNRDSIAHGGASWDPKMNELFGVWLNPVVALAEDPPSREALAADLRTKLLQGENPPAERIETIASYAPPAEQQEQRLVRMRRLAKTYVKARAEIPADLRDVLDRWFTPHALTPITPAEIPTSLREPFAEDSGRLDRVVLLFPSLKRDYNDGGNVIAFADALHRAELPKGAVVGGGFLFMAEVLRLVKEQAMKVVLVVCMLVGIALLPMFRRSLWRVPFTVASPPRWPSAPWP
jgi:hypothetical protein